jgi:predicted nucleotide-binding protein (sugar kinase/HSP70/actin superfamily)
MSLKQQPITKDTSNGLKNSTNGKDNISTNGKDTNPEIQSFIDLQMEKERIRLEKEAGITSSNIQHFSAPTENLFTADQRGNTTLLFGGLTWGHEHLIEGAFKGLGYKTTAIPTPDVESFQLGKEYGNNGQCNPTYFTVGNLVQYLQSLENKGMSREDIIDKHVFVTAGACGPCRFGMYEAEYRLALRNSGFDGFRVILFQQTGGLDQVEMEAGLEMNLDFSMAIINAFNMGDMFNGVGYQIRPYEVVSGKTDEVMQENLDFMHDVMRDKSRYETTGTWKRILSMVKLDGTVDYMGKFYDQLFGKDYTGGLNKVRDSFNEIEVDRFRVKPVVKVTGEFWAQLTEGDGNFNMFRFLEGENAEVLVEPVGTWIQYIMWQYKAKIRGRKSVGEEEFDVPAWRLDKKLANELSYWKKIATMTVAEKMFTREYNRLQDALGGSLHHLIDQYELQRLGHPYYNTNSGGGEGHLEVAKNIYYSSKNLAHMVLSLKPFGCMPSAQSDGAQAAVVEQYKDMIFLPIETSGEGEVNAHSRVQMALGSARVKAKEEFKSVLSKTGKSLEDLKTYVENHPEMKKPMYQVPVAEGIVGTAANFVLHISDLMDGKIATA